MIATTRISRYLPYVPPRNVQAPWDEAEPDDIQTIEYRGHRILLERTSLEFTQAQVLAPDGRALAQLQITVSRESALSAAKMLVDEVLEGT